MTTHNETPRPDDTYTALDCALQISTVIELIEAGAFPDSTKRIHATLTRAYDALMDLAPEAPHDERLDHSPFDPEDK